MSEILLLADTYPPNRGGSEIYLKTIVDGLGSRGHRITVITPSSDPSDAEALSHPNVKIQRSRFWKILQQLGAHSNPVINRVARGLLIPYLVLMALGRPKYNALIAGHILPAAIAGKLLKRYGRIGQLVVVTYGEEVSMYKHGKRMRSLMQQALSAADTVTCLTQSSAIELESLVPGTGKKAVVVPPSVELIADQEQPALPIKGNPILFTLSRLVERKGIDTTIQAVAQVKDKFPELRYYIAGDGPDKDRLVRLAKELEVDDAVIFLGQVSSARQLFEQCDFFCMPNRQLSSGEREGFGIVFLEAGLYGKPSIAGRSGGAVDAVIHEKTGLVVEPGNPDEMAEAILRLATDTALLENLGHEARLFAQQYTKERQVDAFAQILAANVSG